MSELSDFVITEGRAYHPGDVVLLRVKGRPSHEYLEMARAGLQRVTDKTGVEFLLLDDSVEVVEPASEKRELIAIQLDLEGETYRYPIDDVTFIYGLPNSNSFDGGT